MKLGSEKIEKGWLSFFRDRKALADGKMPNLVKDVVVLDVLSFSIECHRGTRIHKDDIK